MNKSNVSVFLGYIQDKESIPMLAELAKSNDRAGRGAVLGLSLIKDLSAQKALEEIALSKSKWAKEAKKRNAEWLKNFKK